MLKLLTNQMPPMSLQDSKVLGMHVLPEMDSCPYVLCGKYGVMCFIVSSLENPWYRMTSNLC